MASPVLRSPLLHAGIGVWILGLSFGVLLWFSDRQDALAAAATLGAFLTAGKVVGITAGLALGGEPWIMFVAVFVPDFGALLFVHPIARYGIERVGRWNEYVQRIVERTRQRHVRREGFIARHGSWGIFLVSLLPIGFYSPLVIAAVGQVMGMTPWQVILPVAAAMAIMTTFWVLAIDIGLEQAAAVDPRLPWLLSVALFGVFLAWNLAKWVWKRRKPAPTAPTTVEKPPHAP